MSSEHLTGSASAEALSAQAQVLSNAWIDGLGIGGPFVTEYLSRSTESVSASIGVRVASLLRDADHWQRYFADKAAGDVGNLAGKQAASSLAIKSANWLLAHVLIDRTANGLPEPELGASESPFLEWQSPGDALTAAVSRFCNTTNPGTQIWVTRPASASKSALDVAGIAEAYGVKKADVIRILRTKGIVVDAGDYFMTKKVANPGAIAAELDPLLNIKQGKALLTLLGQQSDALTGVGIRLDNDAIEQAMASTPNGLKDIKDLKEFNRQAIGNLGVLVANPLAVARSLEILSDKDPRYVLLASLIDIGYPNDVLHFLKAANEERAERGIARSVPAVNIGTSFTHNYVAGDALSQPVSTTREQETAYLLELAMQDPDAPPNIRAMRERATPPAPATDNATPMGLRWLQRQLKQKRDNS